MLVYRDQVDTVGTGAFLRACRAAALAGGPLDRDARTGLLIDVGTTEAALADALAPEADDLAPAVGVLAGASLAAGRLFCGAGEAAALAAALERVAALPGLPARIDLKTPEGYAYYALYPEAYAAAARRFAAASGGPPGSVACVVGLRSIGTGLAAVVAATLESLGWRAETLSLRPRGHPFDRRPVLGGALRAWLAARAATSWFLLVDEGPGLSGSSLAGAAEALAGLGVPDRRIALLPGYRPDPASFRSPRARARWPRHAVWHAPFEEAVLPDLPELAGGRDLSGGAWRDLLYPGDRPKPAVVPWLERRKHLDAGGAVLRRFAGLGRFGAMARARAGELAAAGFAPAPLGLRRGFLATRFAPGRPLRRRDADAAFVRFALAYLAHLARRHGTGAAARPEPLLAMLEANARALLGDLGALPGIRALGAAPEVALDARVRPHEWLLRTGGGFLKTDALDHHRDHFYPGPADVAWDVAGLIAEFDLPAGEVGELAAAALGDPGLPRRLPFHRAAYLAARGGEAAFAAGSLGGSPDGRRARRALARYRRLLRECLPRP